MLLFLYGEDSWRKDQKLKQIVDKFVREIDPSRMNLRVLMGGEADEGMVRKVLRAPPFLARKRMTILQHMLRSGKKAQHEALRELLPTSREDHIVVICEDEGKPKTWKNQEAKAIWEYLEKHAKTEAFKPLWGAKLESAIHTQAKEHGLSLKKEAAALLAVMSGGDLGYTAQEIEKLTAYCSHPERSEGSHTDVCAVEDVKTLSTAEGEANIFEFLDALGNKDQRTLLSTAEEQLCEADPLHLIARAQSHVRSLLALTLAGQAGAQALKLHPFVAKKISVQVRNWDVTTLKRLLFQLMTLEYAAKRGLAADPKAQLTVLLARI